MASITITLLLTKHTHAPTQQSWLKYQERDSNNIQQCRKEVQAVPRGNKPTNSPNM